MKAICNDYKLRVAFVMFYRNVFKTVYLLRFNMLTNKAKRKQHTLSFDL